jgi:hypothetical protein
MLSVAVRNLLPAVTLALMLATLGCAGGPQIRPVAARPVVVSGPVGTTESVGYLIDLDIENAGTKDIPLERFDYVFEVPGVGRFDGRWSAFLTLPPKSVRRFTIPASMVVPADIGEQIAPETDVPWYLEGSLRYQSSGFLAQLLFDAGIRRPAAPFSGSGTFRLERSPQTVPPPTDADDQPDPDST